MLDKNINKDFNYIMAKFGNPERLEHQAVDVNPYRGKLPNALLDLWEVYSIGQFWGGLLRFVHPADMREVLSLALGDDPQIDAARCYVVAYTAFGRLLVWSEQFQRMRVDLTDLTVRCSVLDGSFSRSDDDDRSVAFLFGGGKRDFDIADEKGRLMYDRCVTKHGALGPDECYGFLPALMLGSEANVNSVRRVKAAEHSAILAQLGRPTLVRILDGGRTEPVRRIG